MSTRRRSGRLDSDVASHVTEGNVNGLFVTHLKGQRYRLPKTTDALTFLARAIQKSSNAFHSFPSHQSATRSLRRPSESRTQRVTWLIMSEAGLNRVSGVLDESTKELATLCSCAQS